MRISMVCESPAISTRGNRITALRWQAILTDLGHDVDISLQYSSDALSSDCLIALHARRSHKSIDLFHRNHPDKPIVVCLTGTDLHCDFAPSGRHSDDPAIRIAYQQVLHSLELATVLLLLEPEGKKKIPERFHGKCRVILQSANALPHPLPSPNDCFLVSVVGHLRHVKDPFRTALAARLLPTHSRTQVIQLGEAITDEARLFAESESESNPRYKWLGPVSHKRAMQTLTESHLTVISSRFEGAPSVISEAVVNGTPLLATRIDASIGLLGPQYLGLFDVENTGQLAELIQMAEFDSSFLCELHREIADLAPKFSRETEVNEWENLLISL